MADKNNNGGGADCWHIFLLFLLLVVLGILVYSVWFAPSGAAVESSTGERSIDVTGSGRVEAVPDVARLTIGVETVAETVEEAAARNNQRSARVLAAIAPHLADATTDVRTTRYSVTPQYPPQSQKPEPRVDSPPVPRRPDSYRVTHEMSATLRDVSNDGRVGRSAGTVIDAATAAGANTVRGPHFEVSPEAPAHSTARARAVADARATAGELARLSGVGLGELLRMSESSAVTYAPVARSAVFEMSDTPGAPIAAGTTTVTYSVNASYGIVTLD